MSTALKVSVIVACHNEEHTLAETLEGVAAQEWDQPWEVLFADNGSTDGSRAIFAAAAADRPTWRVVDAGARRGKSYAMNVAMAAARAPAVIFCDADDVPAAGWLATMGRALETHPFVACRVELDRLNSGWVREYRGRYGANETGPGRTSYPPFAAYTSGNCLGMTKAMFLATGRFDENLESLEDIDFCIRAALAGFPLEFVPEAVMHVRFRDTVPALARQNYGYAKGSVRLAKRYAGHQPGWLRRRIRRNVAAWTRLVPEYFAVSFGARKQDPLALAAFHWNRAAAAGKIAGMLRYRSLPP